MLPRSGLLRPLLSGDWFHCKQYLLNFLGVVSRLSPKNEVPHPPPKNQPRLIKIKNNSGRFILNLEASEPKWINSDYIWYGFNSLRLWGLHLLSIMNIIYKYKYFRFFITISTFKCISIFFFDLCGVILYNFYLIKS